MPSLLCSILWSSILWSRTGHGHFSAEDTVVHLQRSVGQPPCVQVYPGAQTAIATGGATATSSVESVVDAMAVPVPAGSVKVVVLPSSASTVPTPVVPAPSASEAQAVTPSAVTPEPVPPPYSAATNTPQSTVPFNYDKFIADLAAATAKIPNYPAAPVTQAPAAAPTGSQTMDALDASSVQKFLDTFMQSASQAPAPSPGAATPLVSQIQALAAAQPTDDKSLHETSSLQAYSDIGGCGPKGNKLNWDWCDEGRFDCHTTVKVSKDLCPSGIAALASTTGSGFESDPVTLGDCQYAYIATYACEASDE